MVPKLAPKPPSQDREHYVKIARLVAGDNPPPWLADQFRRWIASLYLDRHVTARQPTRAQMRACLQRMEADPEYAKRAALYGPIRGFLEAPPLGKIEGLASPEERAEDLRRRAAHAARSPDLADGNGSTKKGAGRALPNGFVANRLYCALIVREAWALIHGEPPKVGCANAAETAEAYWIAACGESSTFAIDRSVRTERLRCWRYQFKKLSADPWLGPPSLILEIQRSLRLAADLAIQAAA